MIGLLFIFTLNSFSHSLRMIYQQALHQRLQAVRTGKSTHLDLSGLSLIEIPENVYELTALTALKLNASHPVREEDVTWYLDKLTEETLNPAQFGRVSPGDYLQSVQRSYTTLMASRCRINTLSERVGELVNLEVLELTGQALTTLPATLTTLPRLRALRLAKNNLRKLPSDFCRLGTLEVLDVQDNPLRAWPDGLDLMPLMRQFEPLRLAASKWKRQLIANQEFIQAAEVRRRELSLGLHY